MPFGINKDPEDRERKAAAKHRMTVETYRHMRHEVEIRSGLVNRGLVLSKAQVEATFKEIASGGLVMVRRYDKTFLGPSAEAQFSEEAKILAAEGYWPATQSFASNEALIGVSTGHGSLTVSFAKRQQAFA
jgi:hypothetical protein